MIKRLLYGYIPWCRCAIFKPNHENKVYYKYIAKHGYRRHLYTFRHKFDSMHIDVEYDEKKALCYVVHDNNRLYFKRGMKVDKIKRLYRELVIEQQQESPHSYFHDIYNQLYHRDLIDVGGSEGLISLMAIPYVNHAYIFECDPGWFEALRATFEPFKDRVTIINKAVSDKSSDATITLDDFFADKDCNNIFIKMDIEGGEADALRGSKIILEKGLNILFSICTYHEKDNGNEICGILSSAGCKYIHKQGFFRNQIRSVMATGSKP